MPCTIAGSPKSCRRGRHLACRSVPNWLKCIGRWASRIRRATERDFWELLPGELRLESVTARDISRGEPKFESAGFGGGRAYRRGRLWRHLVVVVARPASRGMAGLRG